MCCPRQIWLQACQGAEWRKGTNKSGQVVGLVRWQVSPQEGLAVRHAMPCTPPILDMASGIASSTAQL